MLSQLSTILFIILYVDNTGVSEQELLLFACIIAELTGLYTGMLIIISCISVIYKVINNNVDNSLLNNKTFVHSLHEQSELSSNNFQ